MCYKECSQRGFTLIEVMVVLVVIGIMASVVQFNFSSNKPEQILQQNSARFAGIFDIAAEYGMLNSIELGLYVDENSYQFLAYDGTRWTPIPENPVFEAYSLPEGTEISLQLDDLPIENKLLFDPSLLNADEDENVSEEDKKEKKMIPQVYLFSGGDITSFSLTFSMADSLIDEDADIVFKVLGLYTTPLTIEGPLKNASR